MRSRRCVVCEKSFEPNKDEKICPRCDMWRAAPRSAVVEGTEVHAILERLGKAGDYTAKIGARLIGEGRPATQVIAATFTSYAGRIKELEEKLFRVAACVTPEQWAKINGWG